MGSLRGGTSDEASYPYPAFFIDALAEAGFCQLPFAYPSIDSKFGRSRFRMSPFFRFVLLLKGANERSGYPALSPR